MPIVCEVDGGINSALVAYPECCCCLCSEVRYLKFREIRHRKTVKSTARRVTHYALGKMIVIIIIAIAQPVIIAVFFQRQFKY